MKRIPIYYLLSTSAFAQSEEINQLLEHSTYEPNYFSLLFGLFVVIGLIYLTGIIYQKLTKIKLKEEINSTNKVDIISTTSIGQGRNLHVIKINGSYCLIGATQNNITYIKDLGEQDVKDN